MKIPDRIESAQQALKLSQGIKSIWSHEALLLNQRTLIYIAALLEKMQPPPAGPKKKRKLSQWQLHVQKCLKKGQSIQMAADLWNGV